MINEFNLNALNLSYKTLNLRNLISYDILKAYENNFKIESTELFITKFIFDHIVKDKLNPSSKNMTLQEFVKKSYYQSIFRSLVNPEILDFKSCYGYSSRDLIIDQNTRDTFKTGSSLSLNDLIKIFYDLNKDFNYKYKDFLNHLSQNQDYYYTLNFNKRFFVMEELSYAKKIAKNQDHFLELENKILKDKNYLRKKKILTYFSFFKGYFLELNTKDLNNNFVFSMLAFLGRLIQENEYIISECFYKQMLITLEREKVNKACFYDILKYIFQDIDLRYYNKTSKELGIFNE